MWDLANIRNAATHAIRIIAPIRVHFVSEREKSSGRLLRRFAFRFRFPHSPPAHHCLPVFRYRSSWMTRVARLAAACSATEGLPSLRRSASQIESPQKFSPPLRTDRPVLELLLSLLTSIASRTALVHPYRLPRAAETIMLEPCSFSSQRLRYRAWDSERDGDLMLRMLQDPAAQLGLMGSVTRPMAMKDTKDFQRLLETCALA